MKILITGNMGYIGPCVVERLRKSFPGVILIGYDMGFFAGCLTNATILPECRVDIQYFGDVRNFQEEILGGVDAIVYLSAISNDPMGNAYEKVTEEINHKASIDLAKKAKLMGVKSFVFASSCSIYGAAGDTPRSESDSLNPLTAYAKSKVASELDLKHLADEQFNITCLRFSTACGMSDRLRLDLVLNDFVAAAVVSNNITVLSDGTPWRPLIDIKDMARAIEWAISRNVQTSGYFLSVNVGSEEWNFQVRELAEAVAKIISGVQVSINQKATPDNRSYKVNFELFKKLAPNHQPQVDLEESIIVLEKGLKSMKFNDSNFRNSRYIRLKVLTDLQNKGLLTDDLVWSNRLV